MKLPVQGDSGIKKLQVMRDNTLYFGFNNEPLIGDFIIYVRHEGRCIQIHWEPQSVDLADLPYIKDRTGLKVVLNDHVVAQNDCRESGSFPVIRLKPIVMSYLVTDDLSDSLWIEGKFDFLVATSAF